MANPQPNTQNKQPGYSQNQKQGFGQPGQSKNKESENKFHPEAREEENEVSERGQRPDQNR